MEIFNKIVVFDPSLKTENLGDKIIAISTNAIIEELFPDYEIINIPIHGGYSSREIHLIKSAKYCFVGGTNILTNNIDRIDRFVPVNKNLLNILFPRIKNVVLLGVGWCEYQKNKFTYETSRYYKMILNQKLSHSVRDEYSKKMLSNINIKNVINTSCHTTWELDNNYYNQYNPNSSVILFTLTDYSQNPDYDEKLIKALFDTGSKEIYYFPQGKGDLDYLHSLNIYKKNIQKYKVLPYSFSEFTDFAKTTEYNFIGTRLHAGIYSLQMQRPTLIIGIDNRAKEIGRDISLNVISREEINLIYDWADNKLPVKRMQIPKESINIWKSQFQLNNS